MHGIVRAPSAKASIFKGTLSESIMVYDGDLPQPNKKMTVSTIINTTKGGIIPMIIFKVYDHKVCILSTIHLPKALDRYGAIRKANVQVHETSPEDSIDHMLPDEPLVVLPENTSN